MDSADMATMERETVDELNGQFERHDDDEGDTVFHSDGDEGTEAADAEQADNVDAMVSAAESRDKDHAKLAEIRECGDRLHVAKREMETAKEEAKEKKKIWEGIATELCDLVRSHDDPMPLFDTPAVAKEGLPPPPPEDDSWKATPLREALPVLTDAIHRKLEEAGLKTMGELAAWTTVEFSPGRFRALSDIKGIGKGTAEKIEDACTSFWATRPQPTLEEVLEAESDQDAESNDEEE